MLSVTFVLFTDSLSVFVFGLEKLRIFEWHYRRLGQISVDINDLIK